MTSRKLFSCSMGRRVLFLLLGTCCLPTGLARAQMLGGAGPRPDEFKLSFGLGGGYTTNPALRSDSGGSSGDSITDPRAGLMDRTSSPWTDRSARSHSFYPRSGSNNSFDHVNHARNIDLRYPATC